jgi:hypothetical protein
VGLFTNSLVSPQAFSEQAWDCFSSQLTARPSFWLPHQLTTRSELILKVSQCHVTSHNSIQRIIACARAAINYPGWLSKSCIHSWLTHRAPWPLFSSVASFLPCMHTRGYDPSNLESRQDQTPSFARVSEWESPHWTSIPRSSVPQYTMPLRYSIPGLKVYVFSCSHFLCPVNRLS